MYRKTLSFRKTDISNSNVIIMEDKKTQLTNEAGIPVGDNQNSRTAGPRGPELLENVWLLEKLAHFNRERTPERIVHAKGVVLSVLSPSRTILPVTPKWLFFLK